jgi:hypothetical protein|tara:strand:+ start:10842 stop:11228 length:387 start_codon:yes stop_codon:yes gene_type:complete
MMMKRKATHAELRIESKTHQGWFKYDVTIQNVDGSVESIPAYGKDLQDALRRVVHDENISKVELKTKRIPDLFWVFIWFGYILGWTMLSSELLIDKTFQGLFFLGGIILFTGIVITTKMWFKRKNISR